MSAYRAIALLLSTTSASAAMAADELKFAAPASWIVPMPIPEDSNAPADAPIAVLLSDQQISFERGKISIYAETAIKIQNGQGLAIGNLTFPWDPTTSTVTVHKLAIHRGKEVIDVLAGGQKFQIIRREANLELAMLDGRLTASIQPEGLQVGDVVNFATTVEMVDPVFKGHVETVFANWNGLPFKSARARLLWPKSIDLKFRKDESLPALKTSTKAGMNTAEVAIENVEPLLPPNGAPLRFALGRMAETSDYKSWSEVADLLVPSYKKAAVIPQSGPLREEVERIRKATSDSAKRVEMALALVQDRVRYVALLMGEGGYVPASAESTWSRRFGDCKAKTALLLALLHEYGIEAVPVAVNSRAGDALAGRLPMLSLFDHVVVRATLNGKTYWLDGTRTGDVSLEKIAVPEFHWVLPLVPNADLVALPQPALALPGMDTLVAVDASAGIFASSPFKVERVLRGDTAKALQASLAKYTKSQLDQTMREYWRDIYDYVTIASTTFSYEKESAELKLSMSGDAKLDWKDSWLYVPHSGLAYEPDFERAAGPDHTAPWSISFPSYERSRVTIKLPSGFSPNRSKSIAPVKETLAGVEYARTAEFKNGVFSMERSERAVRPEITHAEALAARSRLKALADEDVYLRVPGNYRVTDKDIQAKSGERPSSTSAFVDRGLIYLDKGKYDEAIADFTEANKLDSKDVWPLANRGLAFVWKRDFKSAEQDLAAAEAIQADNKVTLRGRGLMAEFKGDFAGALAIYDKLLARESDDNFARVRRAMLRMQVGKRDDALSDIDTVLSADPGNASALAQRAYISVAKEDWAAAEKDVTAALAADPENATVLATKAMIAMQRRDYKAALDLASEALKRDPDNHYARHLQAQLLKRESGEKGAMQAYDEAVARAPKDTTALLTRAFAHMQAKNFEAAEKDIDAMVAIAPTEPRAMLARGSLAASRGDHKAAVKAYTAALNAAPANAPVLAQRAESYRQLGEFDLALADTDAALKAAVAAPHLRLLRVNVLLQQGNLAAADAEADRLVQENPASEYALVAAGKTFSAVGKKQKAMATIDRAIAVNPVPYIYVNRSQVRPFADLAGKLADLDAALKIEADYEDALAEKAQLLSKAGRHAEAIDLYDRAIKAALDGDDLRLSRAIALDRAGRKAEAQTILESERAKAKTAADFSRLCWTKAINDVALSAALDDCNSALRLDPEHRNVNNSRGMALLKLGRNQDARASYDGAIAKKSGASAYMGRAIARARLGDLSGAQADAEQARKLRPDIDETFEEYGLKPKAELSRYDRAGLH